MFSPLPTLSFEHLARAFGTQARPCVQIVKAPAGARSFLCSRLFRRLARPVLVLATTADEAEETFRELSAYLGPECAALFPSTEVAPYEAMPPYAPAVHDRMRALHRLAAGGPAVVVSSVEAVVEKTLPRDAFLRAVRKVAPGAEIDVGEFAWHLSEIGYARLPSTAETGDFSVRGGIVEVYSPAHPLPARLLLDGDRVESLRWFDPVSQRTVSRAVAGGEEAEELVVLPCSQYHAAGIHVGGGGIGRLGLRMLSPGIRYHGIEAALPLI